MLGKKWLWDPVQKVLMNKTKVTIVNQLILYIIPLILTRTSGTRAVPVAPLFHSLMHLLWCLSAVLQHNTLSECVRTRRSKAPVRSFCCEDDTTQCCAFLRLHWINNLVYNKSEKTFHIYTKHCQVSQTTFTSLPQRWLLVSKTKITFSSWLWKNKEN